MKPEGAVRLQVVPIGLSAAHDFVRKHHRHHKPDQGHKFSVSIADEAGKVRGVAIVGRPRARMLDDGLTLEVTRLASDGCPNACSALYRAAWRVAREMGFKKVLTFTLATESGGSLRGAGWICTGEAGGGSWSRKSRPRIDKHPLQTKLRWEASCS